ncbi:hypothetical protein CAPTEDRAFT_153312 [Capitella teleta]|uniref:L-aminoadipate-semialdehyde dehydrogenase-phosphopantetheinyl transferase n=1 Tax=Capitella teleta TaxID=283909 RepID=R7VKZ3_CAPTE|nr:hypothetical protein CAPTEDRAFT_153312 [Capitella teleta]|eukprot:ELU17821.1 hypothetical protein CAPTEDRAFT_153312 [Capitella teleta]
MQVGTKMASLRWTFRFNDWKPTREQWLRANRAVQPEERERIGRFVFQRDAKAAMSGRLLLRKAIATSLGIPFKEIDLQRTEKGKPFLRNAHPQLPLFNFNVSHQGHLAVLASEPIHQVGVDVMQIEYPRGSKTTEEFFETMNRQFTENEWLSIKESLDEWEQLAAFYRHWCLKESYVKAIGTGIGFSLQRLDFHVQSTLNPGCSVSDTKVYVDGKLEESWLFQETMIGSKHCIAVALHQVSSDHSLPTSSPQKFEELNFESLIEGSEELSMVDEELWNSFSKKESLPRGAKS